MKYSFKIATACGLGGLIGSLLALSLGLFWWVGVLLGGVAGWATYDLRALGRTVVTIWCSMPEPRQMAKWWHRNGSGVLEFTGAYVNTWSIALCITATICLSLFGPISPAKAQNTVATTVIAVFVLVVMLVMMGELTRLLHAASTDYRNSPYAQQDSLKYEIARSFVNPLRFHFVLIPKLIWRTPTWVAKALASMVVVMVKFGGKVFIAVHSDRRMICFVDSALGALIGYYYLNPLVGAVVGAMLGALNYELVSKRWLKLASSAS